VRAGSARPTGHWDGDTAGIHAPVGQLTLHGWAIAGGRGPAAQIHVYRDGVPIAIATSGELRPDVAAAYGLAGLHSGWSVEFTLAADDDGALVEVFVVSGPRTVSLGTRRLHVQQPPKPELQAAIGVLDRPIDGERLPGYVAHVAGWAIVDGAPADVVEVYVGDREAIRLRRCEPRTDLVGIGFAAPADELASGFNDHVSLRGLIVPDDGIPIEVRALGRDGTVWRSPTIRVRPTPVAEPPPGQPSLYPVAPPRRAARPRVAVFTHSLSLGGGELYLHELLMRLVQADVMDLLVVTPQGGPLRAELEAAGIRVHNAWHNPVSTPEYGDRVVELSGMLRAWEADVVLVNTLGVFGAVDAAHALGVPVVWAIHESYDLDVFSYLNWGPRNLPDDVDARFRGTLRDADLLVFESESTRALFEEQLPDLRTRCIRYGIDLTAIARYEAEHDRGAIRAKLGYAPEDRVLLCMGVFQERKAQLALVHAFAASVDSHPNAKLAAVGYHPSDYGLAVERCVEELALGDAARVVGVQQDTYQWYLAADALVSASDLESLPRSVMESMAFGTPVVGADVFGLSEVVSDGVNGWLFEPRSAVALTAALRRVLACSEVELATMAKQCREDARSFDGQGYADEYARLLLDLTHGRRTT